MACETAVTIYIYTIVLSYPRRYSNPHLWYTTAPTVRIMSGALDHSVTSSLYKSSFNSRNFNLPHKLNQGTYTVT